MDTDYIFLNVNLLKKYLIQTIKKPYFKITDEKYFKRLFIYLLFNR